MVWAHTHMDTDTQTRAYQLGRACDMRHATCDMQHEAGVVHKRDQVRLEHTKGTRHLVWVE